MPRSERTEVHRKVIEKQRLKHTRGRRPNANHVCNKCGKELPTAAKKRDHQRRCKPAVRVVSVLLQECEKTCRLIKKVMAI
jgi:hypothetical protein